MAAARAGEAEEVAGRGRSEPLGDSRVVETVTPLPRDVPLFVHVARKARKRIAQMPGAERREIEAELDAAREAKATTPEEPV